MARALFLESPVVDAGSRRERGSLSRFRMARPPMVVLAAFLSTRTLAGPVTVTISGDDNRINREECQTQEGVGALWSNPAPPLPVEVTAYFTRAGDAKSEPQCGEAGSFTLRDANSEQLLSGVVSFTATQVVDRVVANCGLDGRTDPEAGVEGLLLLCVDYVRGGQVLERGSARIFFDTILPAPPTDVTATGGERNLSIHWNLPTTPDSARFIIHFRRAGTQDPFDTVSVSGRTATSGKIENLQNDVSYEVFVVTADEAGNESAPSNTTVGTPRAVSDFFDVYQQAGGREQGCATGPGANPLGVLAALAALARRRRSR